MSGDFVFSIIIPALNEEKYISSCLRSVLDQDFPKSRYEIIVVDNNSTDRTKKIAQQYKIKVVFETKRSLILARLRGFRHAKGKYLVSLDADCVVPVNWLSSFYKKFKYNPKIIAITGPTYSSGNDFFSKYCLKIASFACDLSNKYFSTPLGLWPANLAAKRKVLLNIYRNIPPSFPSNAEVIMLTKKIKQKGQLLFDKDILIKESDRRYKNRLFSFFFKDILGAYVDFYSFKFFGNKLLHWQHFR